MDFLNFNPLYHGENVYPHSKNKRVKLEFF